MFLNKVYFNIKRNLYFKKVCYGKNNTGRITSRGRQNICFKLNKPKYINYNYLFLNNIYSYINENKVIYAKIIGKYINLKTKHYVFKVYFLNSYLKNQIKFLPITKKSNIGDLIILGLNSSITVGNILPIYKLPVGSYVHHIENIPTKGAVYVKNSKKSAFLISIGDKYVTVKLPSGEVRLLSKYVLCIYGELLYTKLKNTMYKAGSTRHIGKRPKVRGVAKNACDHPHGGGEGKSHIGKKSSCSFLGSLFRGVKTRINKKYSNIYIIKKKK